MNAFWVTVQRTEAAERCELHGAYVLKAERDSLVLKDPRTNEILYVWPYRLLRRYGRDKVGDGGGPCVPCAEACSPAGFPWPKGKELICLTSPWKLCSGPCQMPELLEPSATTGGSPGASVILSVLSSHLCHHTGVWASGTPVPTKGMSVQSPSLCGPCPTPTGAIAALVGPSAGDPFSWLAPVLHPSTPQPMLWADMSFCAPHKLSLALGTLAPCSPGSALDSVHPS